LRPRAQIPGEVSERLKEHAWKVCVRQKRTEGSNPSLSAIFPPQYPRQFTRLPTPGTQVNCRATTTPIMAAKAGSPCDERL
jgi:hypothetical protein